MFSRIGRTFGASKDWVATKVSTLWHKTIRLVKRKKSNAVPRVTTTEDILAVVASSGAVGIPSVDITSIKTIRIYQHTETKAWYALVEMPDDSRVELKFGAIEPDKDLAVKTATSLWQAAQVGAALEQKRATYGDAAQIETLCASTAAAVSKMSVAEKAEVLALSPVLAAYMKGKATIEGKSDGADT